MDAKVMEIRLKKWMPIFEEQAKSGLSKNAWCERNGIRKWEFYERQRECRRYLLKKDKDLKDVSLLLWSFLRKQRVLLHLRLRAQRRKSRDI